MARDQRQCRVAHVLEVARQHVDPVQRPEALLQVPHGADLHAVTARGLVARRAVERRRVDLEAHRGALVRGRQRERAEVGDARRLSRRVRARRQLRRVVHEHRPGPDEREVVRARFDERVLGLVRVELRVVEVDDDLASGKPAVPVHVVGEGRGPQRRCWSAGRARSGCRRRRRPRCGSRSRTPRFACRPGGGAGRGGDESPYDEHGRDDARGAGPGPRAHAHRSSADRTTDARALPFPRSHGGWPCPGSSSL